MRLLLLATAAFAQSLTFEVASIKPPVPPADVQTYGNRVLPDRIDFQTATLQYAIAYAYGVKEPQVIGPAWMDTSRWQILAKAPAGSGADRMPAMMQALLADRFKLQIHHEMKEMDAIEIVVGEGGPKLKTAPGPAGYKIGRVMGGGGQIEAEGMAMPMLATTLTRLLGKPVADRTGLRGFYKFTLEYADYEAVGGTRIAIVGPRPSNLAPPEPGTSVFRSIQRLGLKLESRKAPADVIVIDHIERSPTEN